MLSHSIYTCTVLPCSLLPPTWIFKQNFKNDKSNLLLEIFKHYFKHRWGKALSLVGPTMCHKLSVHRCLFCCGSFADALIVLVESKPNSQSFWGSHAWMVNVKAMPEHSSFVVPSLCSKQAQQFRCLLKWLLWPKDLLLLYSMRLDMCVIARKA